MANITKLLAENWRIITIGTGIILFLVGLIIFLGWESEETEKKVSPGFVWCPLRNKQYQIYDYQGKYTEEYQRIRLIEYFLRRGYPKSWIKWEKNAAVKLFGHKGRSKLLVDLVVHKGNRILIVAEVKKDYHPVIKKSAIEHQLEPAMRLTNSERGIYWDGTSQSCWLVWNSDRTFSQKRFP